MKGIGFEQAPPLYRAFDPDDVIEFHAARLILLLEICGRGERVRRIDGRTKLAKLDFFLRYPHFLERAEERLAATGRPYSRFRSTGPETEAPMIRYRFGPWDPRYRQFVFFLEARGLARVVGTSVEGISLTRVGRRLADELRELPEFEPLVERANAMVGNLADWTGTELKRFIYETFQREVGDLPMRQEIQP